MLVGLAAAVTLPRWRRLAADEAAPGLDIVPRAAWGGDLPPVGPVPDEPDVRFLLVHHTAGANDYGADDVVDILRDIYAFHTSPAKGWPDVAYNFFVDRFGVVYEGRTGSLAGPKAVDATGGSQGFAQLGCFVGDHHAAPPSEPALRSMERLLAWLAHRHDLDIEPGATTTFESRGSNRHPRGAAVTTATISGHRDMSQTVCPGDHAYAFVRDGTLATNASAIRRMFTTTTAPVGTTVTTSAATTTTAAPTTASVPTTTTTAPTPTSEQAAPVQSTGGDDSGLPGWSYAALAAAIGGGLLALRRRRS